MNNIQRKRVDNFAQCGNTKRHQSAQTYCPYPKNKCLQYEYDCTEDMKLAQENAGERLATFLQQFEPIMINNIRYNEVINIYFNDYPELREKAVKQDKIITGDSMVLQEYQCFTDIRICKNKLVSCSAWHPLWTGIVAVAYVNEPACSTSRSRKEGDAVNRAVHELNPVLVWSFDEGLKHKLWLENYREVTALSFCPFDENIIVGGCSSGQIMIWDLNHRFQKVEEDEVLTVAQAKYRVLMFSFMEWMKNVKNDASVRAAAGSALEHSHHSLVHTIHWLSPHFECSKTGQIHLIPPEDGRTSKQFITAADDGSILVWDLTVKLTRSQVASQKPSRLPERPAGLTSDVSPYKALDRVWKPYYRILVKKPNHERLKLAVTAVSLEKAPVKYEQVSLTPAVYKISNRIKYRPITEVPQMVEQEFVAGTCEGDFLTGSWEGFEYNQGQLINTEPFTLHSRGYIHDGPVTFLDRHPFIEKLHMTVGGKIFAIWDEKYLNRPLMWRKLEVKLTCCLWSRYQSNIFYLTRDDGTVEIWDFLYRSNCAATSQSLSGKILSNIGVHTLPLERNIIGIGDYNGSFRCFYVPPAFHKTDEADQARMREFFTHEKARKLVLHAWQDQWCKSNVELRERKRAQEIEEQKQRERQQAEERRKQEEKLRALEEERRKMAAKEKDRPAGAYEERAEKAWKEGMRTHMRKVLLQTKMLKLEDLEEQQRPLKLIAQQQKRKMQKQKARFAQADTIYEEQLAILFPDEKREEMAKKSSHVPSEQHSVPSEGKDLLLADEGASGDAQAIDSKHLEDYAVCEENLKDYVENRPYIYVFNWKSMLEEGKERRLLSDQALYKRQIARQQRYENRVKMRSELPQSSSSTEFDEHKIREMMGLPIYPEPEEYEDEDEDSVGTLSTSTDDLIVDQPVVVEQEKPAKKGKKGAKKEADDKKGKKGKGKKK